MSAIVKGAIDWRLFLYHKCYLPISGDHLLGDAQWPEWWTSTAGGKPSFYCWSDPSITDHPLIMIMIAMMVVVMAMVLVIKYLI